MNNNRYILLHTEEEINIWHNFIVHIHGIHYEQTHSWAKVREADGWSSKVIAVKVKNDLIAGVQILIRKIKYIGTIGYISYGPCVKDHSEHYTIEIIEEIKKFAGHENINYLVINLPYFADYMIPVLRAQGFRRAIESFPPARLMGSTLIIDLSKSPDQILAEMKRKTRRNVYRGIKNELEMREGNREDIELFFSLMIQTCERRNSPPTHPHIDFFFRLWDHFRPNGWVRIFVVEYQEEPVCANLVLAFGDIFKIWKFGWNGHYGHLKPSDFFKWKLIELAKSEGYKYFDFVMLDTDIAKRVANNLPVTKKMRSGSFYGPTRYKLGYGGEIIFLPGSYAYISNPAAKVILYSMGFILKQRWVKKIFDIFWKKLSNR